MRKQVRRALITASSRLVNGILRVRGGLAASVVVATRNRETYLELTLAALERQCYPTDAWELVVADEGSSDATGELLYRCMRRGRMEVAVVTALAGERGGALNCAFRAARGRIIVLLGDDRLVEPDFLIRHLIHHSSVPSVVLGDRHRCVHTHVFPSSEPALVGITPQSAFEAEDLDYPERWASSVFDGGQNSRLVFEHFERERVVNPLSWVFFDRGNVSLPREAVMRVNGLDEVFPQCSHGGWRLEDKEFAYRLYKSGLPFRFDPRASAIRQLGPSSPRARSRRLGDLSYFFSRHPELDRSILEPIFLRDDAA